MQREQIHALVYVLADNDTPPEKVEEVTDTIFREAGARGLENVARLILKLLLEECGGVSPILFPEVLHAFEELLIIEPEREPVPMGRVTAHFPSIGGGVKLPPEGESSMCAGTRTLSMCTGARRPKRC
ncbi:MAG: hypothetical protein KKA90_03475 [Nanoarchaeota archaeon]|nr:hypothetical protein [Nanoarchaeota archaeon]